jgi:two-component system, OmpR family, aerobic respiration control protein ArcA
MARSPRRGTLNKMSKPPSRKIHTKDLITKIEKLTRKRMADEKVLDIRDLRHARGSALPPTILVIEDDETLRLALKRIFEGEGYSVIAASDGTQLSQVLDQHAIDLIVLDVGLPWVNGFELAELMKAHADLKSLPLIFVSGRTGEEDIKRGFAVGADDFIKKPFDVEVVKKTVRTLLALAH